MTRHTATGASSSRLPGLSRGARAVIRHTATGATLTLPQTRHIVPCRSVAQALSLAATCGYTTVEQ